jgi:RNA polymerase sigma-70 factor (ECF subfamily)
LDEEWAQIARHTTAVPLDRALTSEELRRAISQLPAISRAVVSLHYLEAMPLADIARLLGVPVGTAKSRLSAGLTRLRRLFR